MQTRAVKTLAVAGAVAALAGAAPAMAGASSSSGSDDVRVISRKLTPSSPDLAKCMPNARVRVQVALATDKVGYDVFRITASGLPKNTAFTVFLLENASGPNFGAAEYIGDFTTNANGRATNEFRLIVQEAFASTVVNGTRVRVDLNRIGAWFADPTGDDFCLKDNPQIVTPFDGDNEAGVQAFNSANAAPLPKP